MLPTHPGASYGDMPRGKPNHQATSGLHVQYTHAGDRQINFLSLGGGYPSTEVQSAYSIAPADRATQKETSNTFDSHILKTFFYGYCLYLAIEEITQLHRVQRKKGYTRFTHSESDRKKKKKRKNTE